MLQSDIDRFHSKVTENENGCWIWTGYVMPRGYGQFGTTSVVILAHRFSWILKNGMIPFGAQIDHICHNRNCVNPDHLRAVTQKQNQENRSGARKGSRSGIRGVSWDKSNQKWIASVTHNRRNYFLGYFEDPVEAGKVAAAKRSELFTHNFEEV